MGTFEVRGDRFFLDGEPFRVVAGAMHYFRVPREYWRDRLLKIKACGFNTVETYVAWNMHEKKEGCFDFSDGLDLHAYLTLIGQLGMRAIVRPGPYICSEWEFGGFPWWLNAIDNINLRCMDETYLSKVDAWFDRLIPIIADCQVSNGGPVIMVQVENEYGSYGNDKEYIRYIANALKTRGIDSLLFTSDGGDDSFFTAGAVPEILKTANFGSDAKGNFRALRKYQPEGPLLCAEYWNGWFDHWGEKHHTRSASDAAKCLEDILQPGNSVSVYMMHGGTNFGLMNGANHYDKYEPTVNSYDDDAPVNEYGGLTEKYFEFKKVLKSHGFSWEDGPVFPQPETCAYGSITLTESAKLFDNLDALTGYFKTSKVPLPMEKIGWGYGLALYRVNTRGLIADEDLTVEARDRANVYHNGRFAGRVFVNDKKHTVRLKLTGGDDEIAILVENMGRTNYGHRIADRKGIVEPVRHGLRTLYDWENSVLPLEDISGLKYERTEKIKYDKTPVFLKGSFTVSGAPKDTFVACPGFRKGFIWINGKLLSRYWEEGPQKTAYLPACFMKEGINEIVVLETEGFGKPVLELRSEPDIG